MIGGPRAGSAAGPSAPPAGPLPGSAPVLRRELRPLERAWPWLAGLLVAGGALSIPMAIAISGDAPAPFRGHTGPALLMAALCVTMTLLALFYSMRKRMLQEQLGSGGGTMMMWLWLHVTLGLLSLLAALLHGGFGVLSPNLSTGKALFIVFALLILSGVAWRLVYRIVPPIAAGRVGNYAQRDSAARAEAQQIEIERLAAGRSARFHELKAWIVKTYPSQHKVLDASLSLPDPKERALLPEIERLAQSRRRALARARLQARYTRILQGFRLVHIPLTLLFLPLLAAHVGGALYLPARVLPLALVPVQSLCGFSLSKECRTCHRSIFDQWATSMHAHAMTSPVTLAQNNQLVRVELDSKPAPDPRLICVNCHGPLGAALVGEPTLPLERAEYDATLLNDGVSCEVCHKYAGGSQPGAAGLSKFQADLVPGPVMLGDLEQPVGNAFHQSATPPSSRRSERMCVNCHNVHYDRNGDGKIDRDVDLVLQATSEEHDDYIAKGGSGTCVSCHMPIAAGTRAADRATIPFEQDVEAPPRVVHDHSFVGVDYPIDSVHLRDPHRAERTALLQSAARLDLDPQTVTFSGADLTFKVGLTNVGAGHNLPTGFAFARQMWLEVQVTDPAGGVLFTSGAISNTIADLCDASTLDDPNNPARPFVQGCSASDPQLVNIQAKLVDRTELGRDKNGAPVLVQANGGNETWLQRLDGGVVARVRPFDQQKMTSIPPGATRSFAYRVRLAARPAAVTIWARLFFRNLPPYFLRALAANQPPDERPQLAPFIPNLQVVEMAARSETVPLAGR